MFGSQCLKCTGRWILSSGPRISHCSFTARKLHLTSTRHAHTHTHTLLLMTAFCHGLDMSLWLQRVAVRLRKRRETPHLPQWASCSSAMMLSWASSSSGWTTCASEDTCTVRCEACEARRGAARPRGRCRPSGWVRYRLLEGAPPGLPTRES